MSTLTVRNLDDAVKVRLRVRAAENGRSMEAEVRAILQAALEDPVAEVGLASRIQARLAAIGGGVDLELPPRTEPARVADFTE